MDVKKCDKCGTVYDPVDAKRRITLTEHGREVDLCEGCYKELSSWLPARAPHVWGTEVRYGKA